MQILNSATKIVLLVLTISLVILTYLGKVGSDSFNNAVMLVLAFYFGQKTNVPAINVPEQEITEDKG